MAEDPEEVLPEQRHAAVGRVEEVRADVPVEEEKDVVGAQERQREQQPERGGEEREAEERQPVNDIPGARDLKIVTMNWPAVSVEPIELKMIAER